MELQRVTKVVTGARQNPYRARGRRSGNPMHMLTLGWVNPHKERRTVVAAKAKKKAKRNSPRAHHSVAHRSAKRGKRNTTRIIMMAPKKNGGRRRRRSSNPMFFGSMVSPIQMGQYVLGGLIGVTVNRVVLPMLPAALTQSNTFATLTAFGLALLEWWAASFIDKSFGAAVGFGALMNAASQGLNAFIPSVGSTIGLSGRGVGDFVPGRFAVPQNPILDAGTPGNGPAMRSAYPSAYGMAA